VFPAKPAASAAALNDSAIENPSFVPDRSGTYELAVTVTDGLHEDMALLTVTASAAANIHTGTGFTIAYVDGETSTWDLPKGITTDASSNIYVVQSGSGVVTKTTTAGVTTFFSTGGYLQGIEDIAYYSTNNQWFVTSTTYDGLIRLDSAGSQTFWTQSGQLSNPNGIALFTNSSGSPVLVVADEGSDTLEFFNPATSSSAAQTGNENFGGNISGTNPYGAAAAVISSTNTYFTTLDNLGELWRTNTSCGRPLAHSSSRIRARASSSRSPIAGLLTVH
jgi:hypothetical protein